MQLFNGLCYHYFLVLMISLMSLSPLWAGSNEMAGCAIDMDLSTYQYTNDISIQDIEPSVFAATDTIIKVGIVALNVSNLYGYEIRIKYDSERLTFVRAVDEESALGLVNILNKNPDAATQWMTPTNIDDNTISISNSLKGTPNEQISPEGSGLLAILTFKVLDNAPDNEIRIHTAEYVDIEGANANQQADIISEVINAAINPFEGLCKNGICVLKDTILMLKILANMFQGGIDLSRSDLVVNNTIDLRDVIYLIKDISNQ